MVDTVYLYHSVGHCNAFYALKWRFWRAKCIFAHSRDGTGCFIVIYLGFKFSMPFKVKIILIRFVFLGINIGINAILGIILTLA